MCMLGKHPNDDIISYYYFTCLKISCVAQRLEIGDTVLKAGCPNENIPRGSLSEPEDCLVHNKANI